MAFKAIYLTAAGVAGATVTCLSVYHLATAGLNWPLLTVLGLTILSGIATLRLPVVAVSFSISDTFTIAAALLFGPAAGTVAVALDSLAISFRLAKGNLGLQRLLFNSAAPAFAMWLAAHAFFWIVGVPALAGATMPLAGLLGPLVAFAGLYFALNSGFVAGAVALAERKPVWRIWRHHFLPLWLSYFGGAAVAALLIALVRAQGADLAVLALGAPIPFILYATFKSVVGRIEDQLGHFEQVNRMHLATIETLAHAIDAKDQVTHGHIRRVQDQSMRLAAALGIEEEGELRALHAASLLHDLGKLAIPEHILNKPGKLTPAEFEKMKEHANIGAEILASVEFPYPVEPIVRYHHENWDGTGYPAGLQGEDIPIGARILQVVDCFDALTSDRPYRPKMTSSQAMAIVRGRAGTMYDPRVVAKFVDICADAVPATATSPASPALSAIVETVQTDILRRLPTAGAVIDVRTLLAVYDLAHAIGRDPSTIGDRIHSTLAQIMPATCTAIFTRDGGADSLVARYVAGQYAPKVEGLVIPLGQRLSGWVAVRRSTIVNSDPALDLGTLAQHLDPPPRSCLSTALCVGEQVVGALTLYSTASEGFAHSHVNLIEALAPRIADAVHERTACRWSTRERNIVAR